MLLLIAVSLAATAAGVAACGEEGISVQLTDEQRSRRDLRSSAARAATRSAWPARRAPTTNVRTREYKDGPNFDQRKVTANCALYAIRNGGFSSGPDAAEHRRRATRPSSWPQFLAKNSGTDVELTPGGTPRPTARPAG